MSSLLVRDTEGLACELLVGRPERWLHTVGVARQAVRLGDLLLPEDRSRRTLVSAAWLHDVGYADSLRRSGFHPLDGAAGLDRLGVPPEVTGLVAHHSGAQFVAEALDLDAELTRFPSPDGLLLDVLTFADQTVGPWGVPTSVEARMADMLRRHGPDSANARAHDRRRPYLLGVAARVRARLLGA